MKASHCRCLVLGGTGALGQAVCRSLASQGARVALSYHSGSAVAQELVQELPEAVAVPLDARKVVEIERAVDEAARALEGLDALVCCIGVGVAMECQDSSAHHIENLSEDDWDDLMAINLKSAFFAARRAVPLLRVGGGGNIVLTGSVDGVKPVPSAIHYATSKAALTGMVRAMGKEFGEYGICANLVAPGVMEAGLSRLLPEELLAEYRKHCGLRRVARMPEVADLIAWLAQHNTYLTGQALVVDGGL